MDSINVQELCDVILKAAGSGGFKNYMPFTQDQMIKAATHYLATRAKINE